MTSFASPDGPAKRKFMLHEDDALRALVERYGTNDWVTIASHMVDRDSRQCKERWFHYLSPDVVQDAWTPAEDALLESKVVELGRKWKLLELEFPGRTDISIKNHFNVLARRRMRQVRVAQRALTQAASRAQRMSENPPRTLPESTPRSESCFQWVTEEVDWDQFSQS
jgi:hypothetical protein